MKKLLYIIPVLLLTIFLKNNVYGAKMNFSTVDDLYNHLSTISDMTYVRKVGDNAHNNLKNSDLFISTKNKYNYYVIFGGDVFFFNSIPKVSYFCFTNYGPNIVYLSLSFTSTNVKYSKFSFNMDTGAPTSALTENYVGSNNTLLEYGPAIGFYTDCFSKDDFYNMFDSNFDLIYENTGAAVVQKKPEFNFIPTYSENYDTCNLKLNIKNPPNYYTLEYAINSSTSTWYTFDNSTGINIQDNCLVIVRMLDENGDEMLANSYNIANIIKKPEFSFIPTYSENYDTCNLKLDIKNPPDNYRLEYAINSSSSNWYNFDNTVGITVEDNCFVIVRMLDDNGDEIFANSFSISLLDNQLSTTYFKVDFDNSGVGRLNFTPIIYYNFQNTFDLYLSINSSKEVYFTDAPSWYVYNDNDLITDLDYFKISSGNTYRLIAKSAVQDFDITLNFKLVNKNTGVTGLERSFTFNMNSFSSSQAISSSTNNIKDSIFNAGGGSSINDNLFASDSLEIDWSMENSKNTIQSFFQSTLSFFNLILSFLVLMPAWITVPLNTLFVLTIVIFVFHVIRG